HSLSVMTVIEPRIASVIGLSPSLAVLATMVFVVFLFRRDLRERLNVTGALWLPVVWVLLMGSRSAAQWLEVLGFKTLGSTEEGTPLDAGVYSALIIAGLYVLSKRHPPPPPPPPTTPPPPPPLLSSPPPTPPP